MERGIKLKIGIIGTGNIGLSILLGVLDTDLVRPADVICYRRDIDQLKKLKKDLGVSIARSNREVVSNSDITFLCVKPRDVDGVLRETKESFKKDMFLVSVVAGYPISAIREIIDTNSVKIARAMPNLPISVGEGTTGIFFDSGFKKAEKQKIIDIFASRGVCVEVESEDLIDAVTGLSGTGPAFIFVMMEALADAGVRLGLSRQKAKILAINTVIGAGVIAEKTGLSFAELKDLVMTPAGTTAEGIYKLEELRFRYTVATAVDSAARRSKELKEEVGRKR